MSAEPYAPFRTHPTGLAEEEPSFPDEPLDRVRDFARSLATAARLTGAFAQSGRRIDLTGLDDRVGLLCAKALDLPPEIGRDARVELILLRTELEVLARSLDQPLPDP